MALDKLTKIDSQTGIRTTADYTVSDLTVDTVTVKSGGIKMPVGMSTFQNVTVTGALTVEGTTTTLDTNLIGVDRVEVGANSDSVVGVAVTQSGSADIVKLVGSGSTVVTVTTGGNVLVGTTNEGTAAQLLSLYRTGSSSLELRTNTTGNSIVHFTDGDPPSGNAAYRGFIEYNHRNDFMKFGTSASGRVWINSAGVGIGTTNPQVRLHILAANPVIRLTDSDQAADNKSWNIAAGFSNLLRFQAINDSGSGGGNLFEFYRTGTAINQFRGLKSAVPWFVIDNDTRRVGIGTSVPDTPVHIYANDATLITAERSTNANAAIRYKNTVSSMFAGLTSNANGWAVDDDEDLGTAPMFFVDRSTGKVGIGLTNPTYNLHIKNGAGDANSRVEAIAGDSLLNLSNTGNANWSGINFVRERSTGTGVVGGSIFMPSVTANNSALLYLQTQTASAQSGVDGALTDNNGVRLKLASQPGGVAADTAFTVEVGASERLRIDSSGFVGIGTDNPQKTLNVFAGVGTTELIRLSQNVDASVQQNFGIGWCSNNDHDWPGAQITSEEYDVSDPRRSLLFYTRGTNDDIAPTERMRINADGQVAIGTNTTTNIFRIFYTDSTVWPFGSVVSGAPSYTPYSNEVVLQNHVRDTEGSFASIFFRAGSDASGGKIGAARIAAVETGDYKADLVFGTRNTTFAERLRIQYDGKVGIGTNVPGAKLHVHTAPGYGSIAKFGSTDSTSGEQYEALEINNGTATYPALINQASGDTLDLRSLGSIQATIDANANDNNTKYFRVSANGIGNTATELFRVHESGDVGIGTTGSVNRLHVYSDVASLAKFERTGGAWAKVDIKAGNNTGNSYLTFSDTDASEVGAINYEHNDDSLRLMTYNGSSKTDKLIITGVGTVYMPIEGAKFGVSQDPDLTTMGATSGTWQVPEVDGQTIGAEMRIGDINSSTTALIRLASYGSGDGGVGGGAIMFTNTRCGSASHHSDLAAIKGARESLGKGYLRFFTASSAANTEKMRIDSVGRVLIGVTEAMTTGSDDHRDTLQVVDTAGGQLLLGRNDTETSVSNRLGEIAALGNDSGGAGYKVGASIRFEVSATHGSGGDYPTAILFKTCNDGSDTLEERVRVNHDGNLVFTSSQIQKINNTGSLVVAGGDNSNVGGNITLYSANHSTADLQNVIRFRNSATEVMRIDGSGRLLLGSSSETDRSISNDANALLQLSSGTTPKMILVRDDTSIVSGNHLGLIDFHSIDAGPVRCARIGALAVSTHQSTDHATALVFETCADNSSTTYEALRICHDGDIAINKNDMNTSNAAILEISSHDVQNKFNNDNQSQYALLIDSHHSGTEAMTSNRTKAGIRVDMEYTGTGAKDNASGSRQSLYGIHSTVNTTKDTYTNYSGYFFAECNADDQEESTTIIGVYGYGRTYSIGGSNRTSTIYGGYFLGYRGGDCNAGHCYGLYARSHQTTNGSGKTGDMTGVYAECEFDEEDITNAYAFRGHMDRDAGTISNGYLFYGSYAGDAHFTNRWGIYIGDSAKNHLAGNLTITGDLNAGAGTKDFRIDHPLPALKDTKDLVHAAIEGPQVDLIYRGKTTLVAGISTVNIDTKVGMTEGTFVLLNRDVQCFTTNETGWTNIKGSVTGNKLTIIAQDNTCTDTISWMVIGERQDDGLKQMDSTDADGKLILEPDRRTDLNDKYQAESEKNIYNIDPNHNPGEE